MKAAVPPPVRTKVRSEVERQQQQQWRATSGEIRHEWLVPAGLVALGLTGVAAETARLARLLGDGTTQGVGFSEAPWPMVLHVVGVSLYLTLGALQFASGLRRRWPHWHRMAGWVLIPSGLIAGLTGLGLTQNYPSVDYDGMLVYAMRLLSASATILFLCLGIDAIRWSNVAAHRAWMIRAYALALGAGTQALTHLPWFVFPSLRGELAKITFMAAGWVINLALAEWVIRGRPGGRIASFVRI